MGVQRNSDGCLSIVKHVGIRSEKCVLSESVASRSDQRGVEAFLPWPPPRTFNCYIREWISG